jgi:formate hydrogenlyase transcriptional activator
MEGLAWPEQIISPKPRTLAESECDYILKAIKAANWIIGGSKGAAKMLGVKRTTLIGKMHRPGLSRSKDPYICRQINHRIEQKA